MKTCQLRKAVVPLRRVLVSIVLIMPPALFSQDAQTLSEDEQAVTEAMNELFETWNGGDVEGHVAMFTEDSIELPPNQAIVVGKEEISRRKQASMERADAQLHARIDELIVAGDWAIVRITGYGTIAIKDGPEILADDKAILIWKRVDGSWKLSHDIWNSNKPANPD